MIKTRYFSYLIRIWQSDELLNGGWQASVEDPTSKQLTYFQSLEALFAFLCKQSGEGEMASFDDASAEHHRPLVE